MANKDLRNWAQEIAAAIESYKEPDPQGFPGVLASQGLKLHETYQREMAELKPEEREQLLQLFKQVAGEGPGQGPDDRRKLYAKMARFYEQFFGWEGTQEPGLRGWFIF